MSMDDLQLSLDFKSPGKSSRPSKGTMRVVEYSPFPWTHAEQRRQQAVTENISEQEICLRVETPMEVGSLLRVTIRDLDGNPARDTLAEVIWCQEEKEEPVRVGLQLLVEMGTQMAKVRRSRKTCWTEVA